MLLDVSCSSCAHSSKPHVSKQDSELIILGCQARLCSGVQGSRSEGCRKVTLLHPCPAVYCVVQLNLRLGTCRVYVIVVVWVLTWYISLSCMLAV